MRKLLCFLGVHLYREYDKDIRPVSHITKFKCSCGRERHDVINVWSEKYASGWSYWLDKNKKQVCESNEKHYI